MNPVISSIVSFFLWHLTWGWYQLCIHVIFFCFFLRVVIPLTWVRSMLYSIILHGITTSIICFTIGLSLPYISPMTMEDMALYTKVYTDIQQVTLSFACAYNACMYCTAIIFNNLLAIPPLRLLVALFLSGVTSALIVPKLINFI